MRDRSVAILEPVSHETKSAVYNHRAVFSLHHSQAFPLWRLPMKHSWSHWLLAGLFCIPASTSLVAQETRPAQTRPAQPRPVQQQQAREPKIIGSIERVSEEIDQLIPADSQIEVLAEGFEWSEGPVWVPRGEFVLFSDIPRNQIVKWKEGRDLAIFLQPSGYTGTERFTGYEPGSNGLTLDAQGRLVMCCHGDRAVKMRRPNGELVVLADRYDGKRLNSPNDLVFHSNGDLYFTDPPYGLPMAYDDPARELDWCGVYRLHEGELTLLTTEMTRPNGIGFSPDYQTLYVAQSDPAAAIWKAFPVNEDGTLGESRLLFDSTSDVGQVPGLPDGMAIDTQGNLWATGPGGVLVLNAEGKLLGRILTGQATANCTFGPDGWLYITADMYFCRVKTNAAGFSVVRTVERAAR